MKILLLSILLSLPLIAQPTVLTNSELFFQTEYCNDNNLFVIEPKNGFVCYNKTPFPDNEWYLVDNATSYEIVISEDYIGYNKALDVIYSDDAPTGNTFWITINKVTIKNADFPYKEKFHFFINYFNSNLGNSCGIDMTIRFKEDENKAYYYSGKWNGIIDSMHSITIGETLNIWDVNDCSQNTSGFELYLTLTSQSSHPRLDWNPYHDQNSVQTYYIYKDDGTMPYATTTNFYYIDTQEWIYTPHNPKDYVSYRVAAKLTNGAVSLKGNKESIAVNAGVNKDVADEKNEPNVFALFQNHPNPFNPTTVINYTLPRASYVTLKVYNALGKEVVTLVNGAKEAGKRSATFDGGGLPSGVYFSTLTAGQFTDTKKLILTK